MTIGGMGAFPKTLCVQMIGEYDPVLEAISQMPDGWPYFPPILGRTDGPTICETNSGQIDPNWETYHGKPNR